MELTPFGRELIGLKIFERSEKLAPKIGASFHLNNAIFAN